jgi:hypothetical protein
LKWFLLVVAFFLFALGVALLIWFSTSSLSENERPAITTEASMEAGGSKLKGKVTAFGLMSDDWIYLSVKGFEQTAKEETAAGAPVLLYQTRAGPDRNGKVDLSFDIPVAFGRFSFVRIGSTRAHKTEDESIDPCFVLRHASEDQSCATLYPPPGPKRPTLSASWEKSGGVNVLNVTVKTSGVDPDDVVLLDMAGNSKTQTGKRRVIFYRSMFSSSSTGVVDATAKAPMPKGMTRACVVATTISTADGTPLEGQPTRTCALGLLDLSRTSFAVITVP